MSIRNCIPHPSRVCILACAVSAAMVASQLSAAPLNHLQHVHDNTDGARYLSTLFDVAVSPDGKSVYTASFVENGITILSRDNTSQLLSLTGEITEDATNKTGIHTPSGIVVSPDGQFVYVLGLEPGFGNVTADEAISVFQRDAATGALTMSQLYKGRGLDSPAHMEISADGNNIYVAGMNSGAITVLRRASNGIISEQQYQTKLVESFPGATGNERPYDTTLTLSPDQQHLYIAINQNSSVPYGGIISHFSRDPSTGNLTYSDQVDYTQPNLEGLREFQSLRTSPDGKFLYAAANTYSTTGPSVPGTIYIFSISASGSLTLSERYQLDDPNQTLLQIYWPSAIEFSKNGKLAYVTDQINNALLQFSRNETTGALSFLGAEIHQKDGVVDLLGPYALQLSPDNFFAYVPGAAGLTVFDIYAGLSITNTPAATSVTPGSSAGFTLEVTNNAGAVAHNTILTFTLPEGGTASAITPSSPSTQCSQAANVVTCMIGTLAQDAAESISITTVAPTTEGKLAASATVTADEVDNDTADNTALAEVTVSSTVTIPPPAPVSPPASDKDKGGGGGAFDWLTAVVLALASITRRRLKAY